MITAGDAREIATSVRSKEANDQFIMVENEITKAANKGNMSCTIEGALLPQVEEAYRGLGFEIKYNFCRNEGWTTVKWGK